MQRTLNLAWVLALTGCGAPGANLDIDLADVEPAPETYRDEDLYHLQYVLDESEQER